MIFNSQGDAKLRQYINGQTITPGDTAITLPKGAQLLGDVIIEAAPPPETETVNITPGAAEQIATPPAGKYFSQVTVAGDPDLIPENIAEGVDIFGVLGTHIGGITGIDFGEVTISSEQETVTINHSLGAIPSWAALIPKELTSVTGVTLLNINGNIVRRTSTSISISSVTNTLTNTSITFSAYSSSYGFAPKDYYWIAKA